MPEWAGGHSEVERRGNRLYLRMLGTPTAEAFGLSAATAADADPDETSVDMVMDCMGLGPGEFSPEELHRTRRGFHANFRRPHEYRIAVAGSDSYLASVARPYVEARSILMTLPLTSLPELQLFNSIADAEAWLDGEDVT